MRAGHRREKKRNRDEKDAKSLGACFFRDSLGKKRKKGNELEHYAALEEGRLTSAADASGVLWRLYFQCCVRVLLGSDLRGG